MNINSNKLLIYIAGALRSDHAGYIRNIHKMVITADMVRRHGFSIIIPCEDIIRGMIIGDYEFEDYFNNTFEILLRCDAVFLTPGWESSNGTKQEIQRAKDNNIPVFDSIDDLLAFVNSQIQIVGECKCPASPY